MKYLLTALLKIILLPITAILVIIDLLMLIGGKEHDETYHMDFIYFIHRITKT